MNTTNFNQIVKHYIERFEYLNNKENQESYKWRICGQFRKVMDAALAASAEDFPSMLYEAKKLSSNLIDSFLASYSILGKSSAEAANAASMTFRNCPQILHL